MIPSVDIADVKLQPDQLQLDAFIEQYKGFEVSARWNSGLPSSGSPAHDRCTNLCSACACSWTVMHAR